MLFIPVYDQCSIVLQLPSTIIKSAATLLELVASFASASAATLLELIKHYILQSGKNTLFFSFHRQVY